MVNLDTGIFRSYLSHFVILPVAGASHWSWASCKEPRAVA